MDVKNVFLNEDLTKELYMQLPHGYDHQPNKVYHLQRALYGLKQDPRVGLPNSISLLKSLGLPLVLMILLFLFVILLIDLSSYYFMLML